MKQTLNTKTMKVTLEGKINYDYLDKYDQILLKQEDGFIIDLVSRVREIKLSYPQKKIQVNYWLADDYCTKSEMTGKILEKIYCKDVDAGYEDNSYMGSSQTGICEEYDTELRFGGHDLYYKLRNEINRFLIIEFNIS